MAELHKRKVGSGLAPGQKDGGQTAGGQVCLRPVNIVRKDEERGIGVRCLDGGDGAGIVRRGADLQDGILRLLVVAAPQMYADRPDGGAQLGVTLDLPDQLDAKATLDLHWTALETQPEALSDSPVGLFDLSEDELTALEKRIGAQIARLLYGEDMTTGETDAVLTGTWKAQVDLTPNLLDALNDALGLDLQMDDPTVMTMLVTFGEDGSYHMDYDAKALREELNALEDALCEKYPVQEALLKQAFAGLQLDVDGSSGTYTASNGILYLTQSGEDWEDILYYSVEDNKLYLTPPQDEESGDWGGMFGSEYPMVFERVD